MNISMLARVRRHFDNDLTPRHIVRANQRKWVMAVRHLGERWLLHPVHTVNKGAPK